MRKAIEERENIHLGNTKEFSSAGAHTQGMIRKGLDKKIITLWNICRRITKTKEKLFKFLMQIEKKGNKSQNFVIINSKHSKQEKN